MKMAIFVLVFLAEFIYSHNLTVDGREILFHIWDVPSSQVRGLLSHHLFSLWEAKNPLLKGTQGGTIGIGKTLVSDGL